MNKTLGNYALLAITYLICALILFPIVVVFVVSLTETSYLTFPPEGLTFDWYRTALENSRITRALGVSVRVGLISAIVASILGVIGGIHLGRSRSRMARPINALFLAPLTVPMIVLAIGLLFFLTSLGLVRTVTALVIGHVVITFPYVLRMVSASIGRGIVYLERAAAVLGANPWKSFWGVTFPSIRAGIVAGMLFAFLVSFNNVTIALFLSGVRTQTLPVLLLNLTQERVSPEIAALSTVLIMITYAVMIVAERRFGIYRLLEQQNIN